jgi:hypothetical protein
MTTAPITRAKYLIATESMLDDSKPLVIKDVGTHEPAIREDAEATVEDLVRAFVLTGNRPLHVVERDGTRIQLNRNGKRFLGVRLIPVESVMGAGR